MSNKKGARKGIKDIWNAFMLEDAIFCKCDIPFCPTTAKEIPREIITWDEAKDIYRKQIKLRRNNFKYDAFVCFYIDDHKFDGNNAIWNNCKKALKILRHFSGVITPDFSTYQDFPDPIKRYATYKMRAFGFWLTKNGLSVYNNVRWGTKETFEYCFEGVPLNDVVVVGTVGGSPRKLVDRKRFNEGFYKMIDVLKPHTIIVYGSANYPCFNNATKMGINVIAFQGKTAKAYANSKTKNK